MSQAQCFLIGLIAAIVIATACSDGPTTPATDNPVTGIITATIVDPHDGTLVFLVEENPEEPDEGQKIFFNISAETEIVVRLRSDLLVPGSIADLAIGRTVRAWKGPIVTLSYPGGTWAPRIEVIR